MTSHDATYMYCIQQHTIHDKPIMILDNIVLSSKEEKCKHCDVAYYRDVLLYAVWLEPLTECCHCA